MLGQLDLVVHQMFNLFGLECMLVNAFQMKNEFVIGLLQPLGLFHLVIVASGGWCSQGRVAVSLSSVYTSYLRNL